jgi:hypothetical protein
MKRMCIWTIRVQLGAERTEQILPLAPDKFECYHNIIVYVNAIVISLKLPVKLMHTTTNVGSSDPTHDGVYSVQHCVVKFVSDLRQVDIFLRVPRFPPPIKMTGKI